MLPKNPSLFPKLEDLQLATQCVVFLPRCLTCMVCLFSIVCIPFSAAYAIRTDGEPPHGRYFPRAFVWEFKSMGWTVRCPFPDFGVEECESPTAGIESGV